MIILIHTSKTMRPPAQNAAKLQRPQLLAQAKELDTHLKKLSPKQLVAAMRVSPKLAETTHELIAGWTDEPSQQRVAIDSFLGDIYSGLQVHEWSREDREHANEHLRILSGLYGVLRPLDGIYPYRFEMVTNSQQRSLKTCMTIGAIRLRKHCSLMRPLSTSQQWSTAKLSLTMSIRAASSHHRF